MKPFDSYYGGKEGSGTYQTIINHIRPHKIFAEPFGGNYSISRKLNYGSIKLINDISETTFAAYPSNYEKFRFFNMDYRDFLNSKVDIHSRTQKVVIFADPPYPGGVRKSLNKKYECEMLTWEEHEEFLEIMIEYSADHDVIICTYPFVPKSQLPIWAIEESDLYEQKLKGWNKVSYESMTRGGIATELIYFNYEVDELADYTYLGDNFTERQQILRKEQNMIRKIESLPILERKRILKSIKENFLDLE